jgi:adenine phosphoribosyltransferase
MMEARLKEAIRDVPDFPKKGIIFKDITPVLADCNMFKDVIAFLAERYAGKKITAVAGIESRGFLFGTPLALALGASFIPIRKKGKLPYTKVEASYELEYGTATIEMHTDAVKNGDTVLVIDDLLATGGTAKAACDLIRGQGADVAECAFVVELDFLKGRDALDCDVYSIVHY